MPIGADAACQPSPWASWRAAHPPGGSRIAARTRLQPQGHAPILDYPPAADHALSPSRIPRTRALAHRRPDRRQKAVAPPGHRSPRQRFRTWRVAAKHPNNTQTSGRKRPPLRSRGDSHPNRYLPPPQTAGLSWLHKLTHQFAQNPQSQYPISPRVPIFRRVLPDRKTLQTARAAIKRGRFVGLAEVSSPKGVDKRGSCREVGGFAKQICSTVMPPGHGSRVDQYPDAVQCAGEDRDPG